VKSHHDERGERRARGKRLRRLLRPIGSDPAVIRPMPGVEFTITGTRTTSGRITVSLGGQCVTVAAPRGQTAAELARALTAEIVAGRIGPAT
jgi:phage tail sheath gpL-like